MDVKNIVLSFFLLAFFYKMQGQNEMLLYPKYEKIRFIDSVPKYKTKCKGCFIDKITYTESHIVISFRYAFKNLHGKKKNVILFAQNSQQAWILNKNAKMRENEALFLEKMINVKTDSTLLYSITKDKQEIEFIKDKDKIDNILCDLVFPLHHFKLETMSLTEEIPSKKLGHFYLNGFNFYKIEIKYKPTYRYR
jgi:hypothetical protein